MSLGEGPVLKDVCINCEYYKTFDNSTSIHNLYYLKFTWFCNHPEAPKYAPKSFPYTKIEILTPDWCPIKKINESNKILSEVRQDNI